MIKVSGIITQLNKIMHCHLKYSAKRADETVKWITADDKK